MENKKEMEVAQHIIECFGGISNIKEIEKDITRIKVLVDSSTLVKRQDFTKIKEVIGTIKSSEFLEIVMNFEIIDGVFSNITYIMSNQTK